jgi:hypothetical protein
MVHQVDRTSDDPTQMLCRFNVVLAEQITTDPSRVTCEGCQAAARTRCAVAV